MKTKEMLQNKTWRRRRAVSLSRCCFVSSPCKNLNNRHASRVNSSSSKKTPTCLARKCWASPFSSKNTFPSSPLQDMWGQGSFLLIWPRWKGLFSKFSVWIKSTIDASAILKQDLPVISCLFAFPSPPAPASLIKIINENIRDDWGWVRHRPLS